MGFHVVRRGEFSHGGKWVHLAFPGSDHRIELNYYPRGTAFHAPFVRGEEFDHFGFAVADPRSWLRRALRAGARPMVGFIDGPWQLVFVRDPDGVWIGACGPTEPHSTRRRPRPRSQTAARRRPGRRPTRRRPRG